MTNTARQNVMEDVDISGVVEKHFGNSHGSLAAALSKAQMELKNPVMDKNNPYFNSKYASLASVRDSVIPVLAKHGIAVVQLLSNNAAGEISCTTKLIHTSGESIESTLSLPSAKKDAQSMGSASTYARRYSLQAIAGVVGDEDDDGHAATEPHKTNPKVADKKAEYEEEKKQFAEKIDSKAGVVVTSINKITQKKGTNSKGEYTVFTIYGEKDKYNTFDEKIATLAKTAKESNLKVAITSKGDKYNSIEAIDIVESEQDTIEDIGSIVNFHNDEAPI